MYSISLKNWAILAGALQVMAEGALVGWPDKAVVGQAIFVLGLIIFLATIAIMATEVKRGRSKYGCEPKVHRIDKIDIFASICAGILCLVVAYTAFSAETRYSLAMWIGFAARASFSEPEWTKLEPGLWGVKTTIHITGRFVRSGVVIGIDTDSLGEVVALKPKNNQTGTMLNYPNAEFLGAHRSYIAMPRAKYTLAFTMTKKSPITFRYYFEGESEGPSVTWQAPNP